MTIRASTIVYPETDGMPLPDGDFQSPMFRRIVGDLEDRYRDVPGAKVNGNTIIYFVEGNPRRSVSPDCYVTLGLSAEALESIERNNVMSGVQCRLNKRGADISPRTCNQQTSHISSPSFFCCAELPDQAALSVRRSSSRFTVSMT